MSEQIGILRNIFSPPIVGGSGGTDYFDTFENLTTGVDPVTIDPTVFLTKITSGGTAGTEIVVFDNYTPDQAGKPHLIVFETQTDSSDIIRLYGRNNNSNPILVSVLGPLADTQDVSIVVPNTTMEMNSTEQGFVLTWTDFAWQLVTKVQEPIVTYPNAGDDFVGQPSPTVFVQNSNNTYQLYPDCTNPSLDFVLNTTAAGVTDPCATYATAMVSDGTGTTNHVQATNPPSSHAIAGGGIRHLFWFQTRTNVADTIQFNLSNIRNGDGSSFSYIVMSLANSTLLLEWDELLGKYIVIRATTGICSPEVIVPIIGSSTPYTIARSGGTYSVGANQNYTQFNNFGGSEIFNLPDATQTGNVYTFCCADPSGGLITIQLPAATQAIVGGLISSAAGTFASNQRGASITFRDIASPLYQVESIVGNWTTT